MKAFGIMGGIGSMLIPAREVGFSILGNIEHRDFAWTNTFEMNFPGAFMTRGLTDEQIQELSERNGIDLVVGHPKCNLNSHLHHTCPNPTLTDDVPTFIRLTALANPTVFVMDNLPKSLLGNSMEEWAEAFPNYSLFPELISNYHYGNCQKHRIRLFMIGVKRELNFRFIPGEVDCQPTLREMLKGLPDLDDVPELDHIHRKDDELLYEWRDHYLKPVGTRDYVTLAQVKEHIRDQPVGVIKYYCVKDRSFVKRPAKQKIGLDRWVPVLTGGGWRGGENFYREDTLNPLTIREKARVQGCPDTFRFPRPTTEAIRMNLVRQIGKFIPLQFTRFLMKQIWAHLNDKPFIASGQRFGKENPGVTQAKLWYCKEIGYPNQEFVCRFCWIKRCDKRVGSFDS